MFSHERNIVFSLVKKRNQIYQLEGYHLQVSKHLLESGILPKENLLFHIKTCPEESKRRGVLLHDSPSASLRDLHSSLQLCLAFCVSFPQMQVAAFFMVLIRKPEFLRKYSRHESP